MDKQYTHPNRYLIPPNFDFEMLLKTAKPEIRKGEHFKLQSLYAVTTILYERFNVKQNKYAKEDFTSLKLEYLRNAVPNAEYYLKYLIKAKVLQRDNVYILGKKSFGYRFIPPFYGTPISIPSNTKPDVEPNDAVLLWVTEDGANLKYLSRWILSPLFSFDSESAIKQLIADYFKTDKGELPMLFDLIDFSSPVGIVRRTKDYINKEHEENYNKLVSGGIVPISLLVIKAHRFTIDQSGYRLHTNISNLRKSLRKHLKYDGKRLIAYDLKNSQPFFLNVLMSPRFWIGNAKSDYLNYKHLLGPLGTLEGLGMRSAKHTLTMRESFESQYGTTFQLFKKLTLEGNLYEYLANKHSERTGKILSRDEIKQMLIGIFFDKNSEERKYSYVLESTVKDCLPGLIEFCDSFKTTDEYNKFALILQNIESTTILRMACKNIAQKYPNMPLFTVHDSVATTEDFAPILGPLIASEIELVVGFKPTIKEEPWF
jgi:hypothetical protein